jgi:hypothetical protein
LLLILETVVLGGDGVKAGGEKNNLRCKDRQLTVRAVLGVTAARETDDTDNITSSKVFVLSIERNLAGSILSLANHLHLDALGADIVEDQLGAGRALGKYSTGNSDRGIRLLFALLETLVILEVLAEVIGDLELVRVGVRLLGLAELVDPIAADFEILLQKAEHPDQYVEV